MPRAPQQAVPPSSPALATSSEVNLQVTDYGSYVCEDDPGEPTTGVRRISVTKPECLLLSWLANGCDVLELGTGLGISTIALMATADTVFTVDPDPWVHEHIWPALDCGKYAERWEPNPKMDIDFVFVDADHTTEAVSEDIEYAQKIIGDLGMIVVHDAKMDEVRAALADDWFYVDTHHGLAIKIV